MITGPVGVFLSTVARFWWVLPLNLAIVFYFKVQALESAVTVAESQVQSIREMAERAKEMHDARLEELQAEHAGAQAIAEVKYDQKLAELSDRAAAADADADRLRKQLAAATTAGNSKARATDPVACLGAINALDTLGNLVGEGVGLLSEARRILGQRDADVQRLLEQIRDDRKTCQATTGVQSNP